MNLWLWLISRCLEEPGGLSRSAGDQDIAVQPSTDPTPQRGGRGTLHPFLTLQPPRLMFKSPTSWMSCSKLQRAAQTTANQHCFKHATY